eukprot:NODE_5321_length_592_cov_301.325885.p2 GENE.NODE_5321_length_592_cov_301.325885~~NODE_5321_length_592_cov_301.325885.p2  ORF type:complete len:65 (-),score=30.48 NODE_5321_length_592_cov_301.325885:349-543(-)
MIFFFFFFFFFDDVSLPLPGATPSGSTLQNIAGAVTNHAASAQPRSARHLGTSHCEWHEGSCQK